mmetsp:Transcript_36592/g.65479  ORF Transcript_36592/g.65479 Transcript_36592/m.65479 type:complete len:224 (-) Transcript_36592:67-738(-)
MALRTMLRQSTGNLCRLAPLATPPGRGFAADATAAPSGKWWEQEGSCHDLYKLIIHKLDKEGPQRPAVLSELIRRVGSPEDAERAVKAAKRFRQRRGYMGINSALHSGITLALTDAVLEQGRADLALDTLRRAHELQLQPSAAAYRKVMAHFAVAGQPRQMLAAFEAMKAVGLRPNDKAAFTLVRGFADAGMAEAAALAVAEFERNGVKVPHSARKVVEGQGA